MPNSPPVIGRSQCRRSGRSVKVQNFAVYRVRGDKICEVWSLTDLAQLRIQLTEKK